MAINRNIVLGVAVGLAILTVAGFYYNYAGNKSAPENALETPNETATTSTAAKPAPTTKPKPVSDVTGSTLTYSQAITIFAKERIQFNEDCKMVPNPVLVTSGTTLMFDNRFRDARVIKLDGVPYTIPGYGFKLLQLRSTKLPHVVKVDCGGGKGTGEITLK